MTEETRDDELPKLKTPNPLLTPVGIIFTIIITLIFAVIVGIGGWSMQDQNTIPSTSIENPINNACSAVADEEIQSCCAKWAIDNDLMLSQCVGTWQITDNQCNWICTTDPEGI